MLRAARPRHPSRRHRPHQTHRRHRRHRRHHRRRRFRRLTDQPSLGGHRCHTQHRWERPTKWPQGSRDGEMA
ncbi:MAG: hypothetical protein B7733_16075 [Myxococcales bacterium FL481]|nr:MAG: hypothetical protein B7733_16075 [Myxococcales bacterium FL481]